MAEKTHLQGANAQQKYSADTDDIPFNLGFIPNATGTLSVRLRGDAATDTFPVNSGEFYPFDVIEFDATGSTTVTAITVFRRFIL